MIDIATALVKKPHQLSEGEYQYLLATLLEKNRSYLHAFPEYTLTKVQHQQWQDWLMRVEAGEPIAYITGKQAFWSFELAVSSAVLIPRSDTECLVEAVLGELDIDTNIKALDLGTGSGAIAMALAHERPHWQVLATDVSHDALVMARKNIERYQLKNIRLQQSDWFSELDGRFDLIISNPPYITQDDPELAENVKQYEPATALFSANNGLADIEHIATQACDYLNSNGALVFEHGFQQQASIADILQNLDYTIIKQGQDLSGLDRFIMARWCE